MTSDTSLPPPSAQTKLQAHTSAVVINTRLIKIVLVHNLVIKVFLKQTWCFYSYSHDKTVYNMLFKTTCTEHRVYNTGTIIPDGTKTVSTQVSYRTISMSLKVFSMCTLFCLL